MGGAAFKRCPKSDDIHGERFGEHGSPFVSGQVEAEEQMIELLVEVVPEE